MNNVATLHRSNRMTDAEYERERAKLRETYGDNSTEAGSKREQAIAQLFARSGWHQKELALKERISDGRVSQILKFGSFLEFFTQVKNGAPLKNLSEKRFREEYWPQTEGGNDRVRFQAIIRLRTVSSKMGRLAQQSRRRPAVPGARPRQRRVVQGGVRCSR